MKYKVTLMMDQTYEVWKINQEVDNLDTDTIPETKYEKAFQGSLADCEAWIRLTEQGYM